MLFRSKPSRITIRPAAMLICAGAAVSLSACAPSGTTSASTATRTATIPVTSTSPATSSDAASATAASTSSGSAAAHSSSDGSGTACLLGGLSIKTGAALSPAGIGFTAEPITLTNTGSAACDVLGWPGVAALDGSGSQIFQAARAGSQGSAVTLRPGQSATAVLYAVTSFGGPGHSGAPSCAQVPNLLVTPPNETHSRKITFGSPMCVAPELTALVAGTSPTISAPAEYDVALELWKQGATAISATQGAYELEAGDLLMNAEEAGVPGTSGFLTASAELGQLSSLPDANLNSTQQSEFTMDVAALDTFFATPGLYH
ncbi:MAG TPA: DUF4232 domain-containing protein [Actinospica sp.]|jgi:hypothetical protein|nr:DUF4232 domain-containing protein [Actinospica sp.]